MSSWNQSNHRIVLVKFYHIFNSAAHSICLSSRNHDGQNIDTRTTANCWYSCTIDEKNNNTEATISLLSHTFVFCLFFSCSLCGNSIRFALIVNLIFRPIIQCLFIIVYSVLCLKFKKEEKRIREKETGTVSFSWIDVSVYLSVMRKIHEMV